MVFIVITKNCSAESQSIGAFSNLSHLNTTETPSTHFTDSYGVFLDFVFS